MNLEQFILDRKIEGTQLERLSRVSQAEREILEQFISTLAPSSNTLREILRLADEVAARDKLEVQEVLRDESILELLAAEKISRKDKQKAIRERLEAKRYPHLEQLKRQLELDLKQITAASGFRFEPPKDLEGTKLEVTFQFNSSEELSRAATKLELAAKSEALDKVFKLLRGQY